MQVFHFTSTLKTRDNFTPIAPLTISQLQKAMKNLSLFPCSFFLMFFCDINPLENTKMHKIPMLWWETGCAIGILLNILVCGRLWITRSSKGSNSIPFCERQVVMPSLFLQVGGLTSPTALKSGENKDILKKAFIDDERRNSIIQT